MKVSRVDVAVDFRNRVSPRKGLETASYRRGGVWLKRTWFSKMNPGTNVGAIETTLPAYGEWCTVLEAHLRARRRFCCFAAVLTVRRTADALSV